MGIASSLLGQRQGTNIVTSGLTVYLDAANLSSYPGSGTTWTDMCGTGAFTLSGTTSYTADAGGGIAFGASSQAASTGSSGITTSHTISVWLKHTGTVSTAAIQRYVTISTEAISLRHNVSSAGSLHYYQFNSAGTISQVDTSGQIVTNTYYNLVATYNGSTMTQYKNAVTVGTPLTVSTTPRVSAGITLGLTSEPFIGNMYLVHIYNRALTADEITTNFNCYRGRFGL